MKAPFVILLSLLAPFFLGDKLFANPIVSSGNESCKKAFRLVSQNGLEVVFFRDDYLPLRKDQERELEEVLQKTKATLGDGFVHPQRVDMEMSLAVGMTFGTYQPGIQWPKRYPGKIVGPFFAVNEKPLPPSIRNAILAHEYAHLVYALNFNRAKNSIRQGFIGTAYEEFFCDTAAVATLNDSRAISNIWRYEKDSTISHHGNNAPGRTKFLVRDYSRRRKDAEIPVFEGDSHTYFPLSRTLVWERYLSHMKRSPQSKALVLKGVLNAIEKEQFVTNVPEAEDKDTALSKRIREEVDLLLANGQIRN